MTPLLGALDELCPLPQWVCWKRLPPRTAGAKPVKLPLNPHTGTAASSTDPTTWGTGDEAVTALERHPAWAGVGFVFTFADPYCGVDLDGCYDAAADTLAPWAERIVRALDSYTEISPSNTGVKMFLRGSLPAGGRRKGAIELYDCERFFTVTTRQLPGASEVITDAQGPLSALHAELFGDGSGLVQPRPLLARSRVEPDDAALLERMFRSANGSQIRRLWDGDMRRYADSEHPAGNPSSADFALCSHLAFWTGGDTARVERLFRQSGLWREKWDAQRGTTTYGARTVARVGGGRTAAR